MTNPSKIQSLFAAANKAANATSKSDPLYAERNRLANRLASEMLFGA